MSHISLSRSTAAMMMVLCAVAPHSVQAAEPLTLVLKDHAFVPAEISARAGERFRIEVINQDPSPAEFESSDLRVEKVIVANGRIAVMVGPLKPGRYAFFDEYHSETAKGTLIVTEQRTGN